MLPTLATRSMVGLVKEITAYFGSQCSLQVLTLSSGTNKLMDTTNAKTHHDFVNPIYPASTKVIMIQWCYLCTRFVCSAQYELYLAMQKATYIHRRGTSMRMICGNRLWLDVTHLGYKKYFLAWSITLALFTSIDICNGRCWGAAAHRRGWGTSLQAWTMTPPSRNLTW